MMRILPALAVAAGVLWFAHSHVDRWTKPPRMEASRDLSAEDAGGNHFSPEENLERLDLEQLRRAQQSVDVAMFAFSDQAIARALRELSGRGVIVRLYRDRGQYEAEELKAVRFNQPSSTRLLLGARNVQIRVKQGSERNLMHLKSVCINRKILRDGSANWSPSGEKSQDNNARFTSNPEAIKRFERVFEAMWERPGNLVVQ
jgi:phosphatidylserine/phosphatidylglycerophosphate/cardiolipin synthase-like enzyme